MYGSDGQGPEIVQGILQCEVTLWPSIGILKLLLLGWRMLADV